MNREEKEKSVLPKERQLRNAMQAVNRKEKNVARKKKGTALMVAVHTRQNFRMCIISYRERGSCHMSS